MPEINVNSSLSTIWSLFNRAGISDNLIIIEHIAALLVEDRVPSSVDLRLRMPDRPGLNLDEIRRLLENASRAAGGKATLFDRYIVFRLQERLRDRAGHYPTPRHIVQFMHHLVGFEDNLRLADFACGTGGFLVMREKHESQAKEIVGIDNSPEWARLAWANTQLHDDRAATVIVDNPFRVLDAQGELPGAKFDCILMNPPFGAIIDEGLSRRVVEYEVGNHSETALTALALHSLAEGGRTAILVPSGLLNGGGVGERELRERLIGIPNDKGHIVGNYVLKTVISLPKDALQPYSTLQTYLLLASRTASNQQPRQHATWFFQAERDGYPKGKRDLTSPPVTPNDLTIVEEVLRPGIAYTAEDYRFPVGSIPLIGVRKIISEGTYMGVVVEALNNAPFTIAYLPRKVDKTPPIFLAEAIDHDNDKHHIYVIIILGQDVSTDMDEDKSILLRRSYYGYGITEEKDIPAQLPLLEEPDCGQAIAIMNEDGGRILGVAISTEGIVKHQNDLRPKEYVKKPSENQPGEISAALLGRVRNAHTIFLDQVDTLLGRLELTPIVGLPLPSVLQDDIQPLTRLSKEQDQFWQRICTISEQRRETMNGLFTLEDIQGNDTREATQLVLDLMERLGVIIPITIVDPNSREALPTILYRRITERDIWK